MFISWGPQTLKDATSFFERRLDYVTKNLENLQQGLIEKHKIREGGHVCDGVRDMGVR